MFTPNIINTVKSQIKTQIKTQMKYSRHVNNKSNIKKASEVVLGVTTSVAAIGTIAGADARKSM